MKVTIIVPIYNREKYIEKCIKSLIDQTYKNIEVVLVNDGSMDLSGKICEDFAKKDNRIKYFYKENGGVSSARNFGIEKSTGNYITFVDSDDSIDKNYIEILIKNTENEENLAKINAKCNEIVSSELYLQKIVSGEEFGTACMYLFNRKIIKDLRFDESLSHMEDTLFTVQYIKKIKNIKLINQNLYLQEITNNSLTTNSRDALRNIIEYFNALKKIKDEVSFLKIENVEKIINLRLVSLLQAEFSKNLEIKTIKKIIESEVFKTIIKNNSKVREVNSVKYKMIILALKTKNAAIIKVFFGVKYLITKIKNKVFCKGEK